MKDIYIHIGLPRTATTFFQQHIFPNLTDISFYGVETAHYSEAFNKLQYADDSIYDKSIFNSFIEKNDGKNILLSNEYLSGQSTYLNNINRSIIANRLKSLFPNAKILIVLRNQIDLLQSLYAINVQWKETRAIDDIIWKPFQAQNQGGPASSHFNTIDGKECLDGYDYLPLVDLYKKLFPTTTVLLFEELKSTPKTFANQLAHFFDCQPVEIENLIKNQPQLNQGVSASQAAQLIKLNKKSIGLDPSDLRARFYNKRKRSILQSSSKGEKPTFSDSTTKYLKAYFSEKNLELSKRYPEIGISNYGTEYYLNY